MNILTSGAGYQYGFETTQKIILLNIIIIIGVFFLVFYSVAAYRINYYVLCFFNIITAICLCGTFYYLRKTNNHLITSYVALFFVGLLFIFLFVTGGVFNSGHLWSYTFPLFALFNFGRKKGTIITLIFISIILLLVFPDYKFIHHKYHIYFINRYIGSYIVLFCIAYFSEYVREKIQEQIIQKNIELEDIIEDLKKAHEALRANEERFRALTEKGSDLVLILDEDSIFTYASQSTGYFGYSPVEMVGRTPRDIVHPDDLPLIEETIKLSSMRPGETVKMPDIRARRKNGSWFWLRGLVTCLFDQAGIHGIVFNGSDITERKEMEEALRKAHSELEKRVQERTVELEKANEELQNEIIERKKAEDKIRESEEKYRDVVENATDVIYSTDIEGNFKFVNTAGIKISGYSEDELQNLNYLDLIIPEHRKRVQIYYMRQYIKKKSISFIEYPFISKTGEVKWFAQNSSFIKKDGEILGFHIFARDITERKKAEDALRNAHHELEMRVEERTKELKEANAELTQYAYVVSHDLKAPLRAIHNYSDFLSEELEGTFNDEQKDYIEGINSAVHQGNKLVEDLLTLSRVGTKELSTEPVDIGTFLRELIDFLDLPPDIEVVMENDLPVIETEITLLRQIFQNLISNAVKFNNSPHKRIEFGVRPAEKGHCEIFVRDNGIGIDSRYQEQIFRVFQRLHTNKEYKGTGIGLAIVKKAVSKLNGSVRVESKPGKGSTFSVVLPGMQKGY